MSHFVVSEPMDRGFTLIELLVVIAVIALLAVLLMPSFSGAHDFARNVTCQKNLKELSGLLHKGRNGDGILPTANSFFSYVTQERLGELMVCPDDNRDIEGVEEPDDMSNLYIVQNCTQFSNLQDVIDLGRSLEDNQVLVNPIGGVSLLRSNACPPGKLYSPTIVSQRSLSCS